MKDNRMRKIRKKIRKVGKNLTKMDRFLKSLPSWIRDDVKYQLQIAFEAGREYGEIQNLPHALPVDEEGAVRIGPALRYHIMEMRKVYTEMDQLHEIVADIFDRKSQQLLRELMRKQEEDEQRVTRTEITDITVDDGYGPQVRR